MAPLVVAKLGFPKPLLEGGLLDALAKQTQDSRPKFEFELNGIRSGSLII